MIKNPVITYEETKQSIYVNSGFKNEENFDCKVLYYSTGADGAQVELTENSFERLVYNTHTHTHIYIYSYITHTHIYIYIYIHIYIYYIRIHISVTIIGNFLH